MEEVGILTLSSHGNGFDDHFQVPENVRLITYGTIGQDEQIFFFNSDPNKICKFTPFEKNSEIGDPGGRIFEAGSWLPNYHLWSDENKRFYSGVRDCHSKSVIINIDALPDRPMPNPEYIYKITLKEVITELVRLSNGQKFVVHLLICMGGEIRNPKFYQLGLEKSFENLSLDRRFPPTQSGFTTPFGFGPRGGRTKRYKSSKSRKARRKVK
jgi:hypothetical protein